MQDTEQKHGWAEYKPFSREDLGRVHEEDRGWVDDLAMLDYLTCNIDLAIPGYDMWDFEWNRGEPKSSKKIP